MTNDNGDGWLIPNLWVQYLYLGRSWSRSKAETGLVPVEIECMIWIGLTRSLKIEDDYANKQQASCRYLPGKIENIYQER